MRETVSRSIRKDGTSVYTLRGSEFGMCEHRHIAYLRGLREGQPNELTRKMFRAGNDGEPIAKAYLQRFENEFFKVAELASGWQNQTSVKLSRVRNLRETNLICSPDGRIVCGVDLRTILPPEMIAGYYNWERRPDHWALEVKCYGDSSLKKLRSKGVEEGSTLAYQTSGVAAGYEVREGTPHGVIVMALKRGDVKDKDGKTVDYFIDSTVDPVFVIYEQPHYTLEQCLDRCDAIIDAYEAGKWIDCTSKYFCRFPHQPMPMCSGLVNAHLAALHETYEAYKVARREAEGVLAGLQPGQIVDGYRYHREMLSLPVVNPL